MFLFITLAEATKFIQNRERSNLFGHKDKIVSARKNQTVSAANIQQSEA